MAMAQMTPKERMLAILHRQPCDKMPFVQYDDMSDKNENIWNVIGKNNMGILRWVTAYDQISPHCTFNTVKVPYRNRFGYHTTLETPVGTLHQTTVPLEDFNGTTGFTEHFVKNEEDLKILKYYLEDIKITPTTKNVNKANEDLGDYGLPHVSLPRTPYQALWIEWALIEDVVALMMDEEELCEEIMLRLDEIMYLAAKATVEARNGCVFHHVTTGDNIHAPMIGNDLFKKWNLPLYNKITETLHTADIPFFIHMDGDLQPLVPLIDQCHFDGFDSFSPLPDNDSTVEFAVNHWKDKFIWCNFPSSVHLSDPAEIYAKAKQIIHEAGDEHRVWIQISENCPTNRWPVSFPPILRAIEEEAKLKGGY